ncbi:MAG: histidine kinase N-terminal domain-containing protein, partial [bacterium]|nr:histidine kinase N-terminal domain-containing protein [bacterium]
MSDDDVLGAALEVLNDAERVHYDRLVATTALLADISFADILVLLPADTGGRAGTGDDGAGPHFVVTAHSRPITSQTVHPDDLLGGVVAAAERPLAALALRTGV